ncbi:unnamed protein product [Polarella glacialis]|uniref:Uncharacterized protein n=1 Tax=Polarella glacialis TaxID=89957 RepID=A0A813FIE1_POLGL|nr:unnamed protein product [Polarella glacialis]CAE8664008.1 unnamed protein product [Polarella glacialis]
MKLGHLMPNDGTAVRRRCPSTPVAGTSGWHEEGAPSLTGHRWRTRTAVAGCNHDSWTSEDASSGWRTPAQRHRELKQHRTFAAGMQYCHGHRKPPGLALPAIADLQVLMTSLLAMQDQLMAAIGQIMEALRCSPNESQRVGTEQDYKDIATIIHPPPQEVCAHKPEIAQPGPQVDATYENQLLPALSFLNSMDSENKKYEAPPLATDLLENKKEAPTLVLCHSDVVDKNDEALPLASSHSEKKEEALPLATSHSDEVDKNLQSWFCTPVYAQVAGARLPRILHHDQAEPQESGALLHYFGNIDEEGSAISFPGLALLTMAEGFDLAKVSKFHDKNIETIFMQNIDDFQLAKAANEGDDSESEFEPLLGF